MTDAAGTTITASAATLPAPARTAEQLGRLVICGAFAALAYALWAPHLPEAATWAAKELRILPRMTVFNIAVLMALVLQGGRPSKRVLLWGGIGAMACLMALLSWHSIAQPLPLPTDRSVLESASLSYEASGGVRVLALPGAFLDLARFELALIAAIFIGTWLGRGISTSGELLMLLICAVAGDVWLSTYRVPESVPPGHVLTLLRVPWPPPVGHIGLSPALTDLIFLSAVIEAGRALRFHMLSMVVGAVMGYLAASFLALEPWPAWPALSMSMCGSGVLVGCWPDLKCSFRDAAWALMAGTLLLLVLLGLSFAHRRLNPVPEGAPDDGMRYRGVTMVSPLPQGERGRLARSHMPFAG